MGVELIENDEWILTGIRRQATSIEQQVLLGIRCKATGVRR